MALHWADVDEVVLLRARGEYLEMPGLRLTPAQAQRLWGVDEGAARSVIRVLVEAKFLRQTPDGAFVRADSGRTQY